MGDDDVNHKTIGYKEGLRQLRKLRDFRNTTRGQFA